MGPPPGRPATALRDGSPRHVGVRRAGRHSSRLTPQPGRRIPFEGEARGGGRRPWCGGQLLTNPAALSRNPAACQSPLASDRGLAPVQTLACKQAGRLTL